MSAQIDVDQVAGPSRLLPLRVSQTRTASKLRKYQRLLEREKKAEETYDRNTATGVLHRARDVHMHPSNMTKVRHSLSLHDLECVQTLGKGAFGTVLMVERKEADEKRDEGGCFALKVVTKKMMRAEDMGWDSNCQPSAMDLKSQERRTLSQLPWHPFVAGLIDCFEDELNSYLLLELGSTGMSLNNHIQARGPLPTADARFYFANLVLAIEWLHHEGVVHCDVKPSNIILGADGYLKLCDFGLSANATDDRKWGEVGTIGYGPPECIERDEEGTRIPLKQRTHTDWWASACVLFEMVAGYPIFRNCLIGTIEERRAEMLRRIRLGSWRFPDSPRSPIDEDVKNLIRGMLHLNPTERFGTPEFVVDERVRPRSNDSLKAHPFLHNVRWSKMLQRTELSPYLPSVYPDFTHQWHKWPLPEPDMVPGLKVPQISTQLKHDDRYDTLMGRIRNWNEGKGKARSDDPERWGQQEVQPPPDPQPRGAITARGPPEANVGGRWPHIIPLPDTAGNSQRQKENAPQDPHRYNIPLLLSQQLPMPLLAPRPIQLPSQLYNTIGSDPFQALMEDTSYILGNEQLAALTQDLGQGPLRQEHANLRAIAPLLSQPVQQRAIDGVERLHPSRITPGSSRRSLRRCAPY